MGNRNLLKTQVMAEHVGNVVVFSAADLTPTTGPSSPVDEDTVKHSHDDIKNILQKVHSL